jgi:hypothetical protein
MLDSVSPFHQSLLISRSCPFQTKIRTVKTYNVFHSTISYLRISPHTEKSAILIVYRLRITKHTSERARVSTIAISFSLAQAISLPGVLNDMNHDYHKVASDLLLFCEE